MEEEERTSKRKDKKKVCPSKGLRKEEIVEEGVEKEKCRQSSEGSLR